MHNVKRIGWIALSFLLLFATGPRAGGDAKETIRELDRQWVEAVNDGDLDWIAAIYTDDAHFLPPGSPAIQGRDAIRKAWKDMLGAPGFVSLTFEPTEIGVSKSGDVAYDIGTSEFRTKNDEGKTVSQAGKYVVVWKKTDGGWKVKADIFNPNSTER